MSITVIIPTYNEEKYILQAIQSAQFADEILVIDSYSTDQTVAIAEANHCKVIQRVFDNFSNQKNYAMQHAQHDWIMLLDADELLVPRLQQEIATTVQQKGTEYVAFTIPRHNFFMTKFLSFGSNRNERLIRCFHRKHCHYEGLVHEKLIYDGKLGQLSNFMYHYTYTSLSHFIAKKNKYATLQSQQLLKKQKKATPFHIIIKPLFRFFNELILRRGILDGIPGITTTAMNGYGVLSRYIKLRSLQHKSKHPALIEYTTHTDQLHKEAQQAALNKQHASAPTLLWASIAPVGSFLYYYIGKLYFLKGIEGYALSYLQGFKKFQTLAYRWMHYRDIN